MKFIKEINIVCLVGVLSITVLTAEGAFAQDSPWQFTPSALSHTIFISSDNPPTFDGVPISVGDFIGVFYLDGENELQNAGFTQWDNSDTFITAYGDNGTTPGFATGENIQYKLWRTAIGCEILDIEVEYLTGGIYTNTNEFSPNGISGLERLEGISSSISYSKSQYCENEGIVSPQFSAQLDAVSFSAEPGLALNESNGEINLTASEPGTYTIEYETNTCLTSNGAVITVVETPDLNLPSLTTGCGAVILGNISDFENTYAWSTGENSSSITVTQSGIYTVVVGNAQGCTNNYELEAIVSSDIDPGSLRYEQNFAPCATEGELKLVSSEVIGGIPPFSLTAQGSGGQLFLSDTGVFDRIPEDSYEMTITDSLGCTLTISNFLVRNELECADAILAPNQSGPARFLFIEETGIAEVYDRSGRLRTTLNTPIQWDGTDSGGDDLSMGVYVIMVNGKKKVVVTIVK